MEISLHFLSQNSLRNVSFSPCTLTTSLFCLVVVATSADYEPSASSTGMCHDPCPGIGYCYCCLLGTSSAVVSRSDTLQYSICLYYRAGASCSSCALYVIKWCRGWSLSPWCSPLDAVAKSFPLGVNITSNQFEELLPSWHTFLPWTVKPCFPW